MAQLSGFQHFSTHFGSLEKLKQNNTYVSLVPKQAHICIFILFYFLFHFVWGFFGHTPLNYEIFFFFLDYLRAM